MRASAYRPGNGARPVRQDRGATSIGKGSLVCSIWQDPRGHRFQFGAKGSTLELSCSYAQALEMRAGIDAFIERCRQLENAPDLLHSRKEVLAP
jgi:hypothetical protein